jgi:heat shock protein HslJ
VPAEEATAEAAEEPAVAAAPSVTETQPATGTAGVAVTTPVTPGVATALRSGLWTWVNTTMSDGTVIAPPADSTYGLLFLHNGRIDIRAGCNRGLGRYAVNDGEVSLRVTGFTRLYCGPDQEQSTIFLTDLARVSGAMLQDNDLYLMLEMDSGTIHLTRQP